MKADNDLERVELQKEAKLAQSFKFTTMKKKVAFLPSVHQKGFLQDGVKNLDDGVAYMSHREKEALMFPDKVKEKKKFNLVDTKMTGYIGKPVGQEMDTYDQTMLKYIKSRERGAIKPIVQANGDSIKQDPATRHIGDSKGVWQANSFTLKQLDTTTKLSVGRQLTPRGTLRAITIDRNFSKQKWLYNKGQLDDFHPDKGKKDLERSKSLRKISRRQDRQRSQIEAKLANNKTFYSSMSSKMGGGSNSQVQNTSGAFFKRNNESKTVSYDNSRSPSQ